ncbi:hypothetical protein Micbo1qcDRAFT_841 [Microdochium bolleyi]|uniref:Secreted protein n=1 Tax=Microdochium bolleyi TaxID=196109 RepID=A0A136JH65_9PEZI|nr:hypothetical protein Micbo1qcDRAFT_841 [Microdochium bolleyi]
MRRTLMVTLTSCTALQTTMLCNIHECRSTERGSEGETKIMSKAVAFGIGISLYRDGTGSAAEVVLSAVGIVRSRLWRWKCSVERVDTGSPARPPVVPSFPSSLPSLLILHNATPNTAGEATSQGQTGLAIGDPSRVPRYARVAMDSLGCDATHIPRQSPLLAAIMKRHERAGQLGMPTTWW